MIICLLFADDLNNNLVYYLSYTVSIAGLIQFIFLLIFPASAFFTHGVKKIKSGLRYCVNSFLSPDLREFDNKFYKNDITLKSKYKHSIFEKINSSYTMAKSKFLINNDKEKYER